MCPRPPCARNRNDDIALRWIGLRRHGTISVVAAPRRSDGYAVGAAPTSWYHGVRNEAHQTCAEVP